MSHQAKLISVPKPELAVAREYALKQNETETYVVFVDGIVRTLKNELGYK